MIYREKSQKVELIGNYVEHIQRSANISELITELSYERRYSYFYGLKDSAYPSLLQHRIKTDSIMRILGKSKSITIKDYKNYTFLDSLPAIRGLIDSCKTTTNNIIDYYTNAIFRLNTLESEIPANTFLKPIYQDLIAQRILAQMITYFGIIRTNVFNVLYTKKDMSETLYETVEVYKVYKTYEKELFQKAAPFVIHDFNVIKKASDLQIGEVYLDSLFNTPKNLSSSDANWWWKISGNSMTALRNQQLALWKSVDIRMKEIYQQEKDSKNETLVFLLIAILLVTFFVYYAVSHIHKLLSELKHAATKISKGASGLQLKKMSGDIIGDLADCIIDIDKNNLMIAQTANQIGKGNFTVKVKLRSEEDLLGISIKRMKNALQEYASQKDKIQKETEDLVYRRDEFFSIASHELKTPVTSLKAYTQLMLMDMKATEDSQQKDMLERMDTQINKLTALINNLLDTSKINNGHFVYNKELFSLKDLITETIDGMSINLSDHEIIFNSSSTAKIYADRDRIGQVIYNFLTNAMKYASEDKRIIVTLKEEKNMVVCTVKDFGKGIVVDEQKRIFERFYRISGHNLNTFPGLGLGLFICKEIIQKHHGKIGLESEKGKGSTFHFELPIEKVMN